VKPESTRHTPTAHAADALALIRPTKNAAHRRRPDKMQARPARALCRTVDRCGDRQAINFVAMTLVAMNLVTINFVAINFVANSAPLVRTPYCKSPICL